LNLLGTADSFVAGGQTWQRPEPVSGLSVQSGRQQIEVTLWHDEFPTVRNITADLPDVVSADVPVSLQVSVEPAQGNARVEVVPVEPGVFGRRRMFLEWRRMSDSEKTPDDWLNELPTLFPGLLRRAASSNRWYTVKRMLDRPLLADSDRTLFSIIERMKQRDPTANTREDEEATATAISSDGEPPGSSQVLDQFVQALVARLRTTGDNPSSDLVRALAYTSTPDTEFQQFLGRRLLAVRGSLTPQELTGCGWCLRDPRLVANFAEVLAERLERDRSGVNNWLKAFAEILRYRDNATHDIPSTRCEQLSLLILQVFEAQRSRNNFAFLFRNSCLCIVYLLRRRAYDDDYLQPGNNAAEQIKATFNDAIHDLTTRRAIGGSIRLDRALQTMIKFIDRQGPPLLSDLRGLAD
jgi:hypothetical protein